MEKVLEPSTWQRSYTDEDKPLVRGREETLQLLGRRIQLMTTGVTIKYL